MRRAAIASARLLAFLLSIAAPLAGQAVPSGFSGQVTAQAYSSPSGLLFLGEPNGYLDAFDPLAGRVIARYRPAPYPISLIACHPEKAQLSVAASDGISRHSAFLLEFRDGGFKELGSETLAEKPEYLCYSPKGGLLAIASRAARGIILKSSEAFADLPLFPADCGPASFAAIGSSEKSLLQYAPQGRILFRALPGGEILQESKTLPALSALSLSGDKKILYALNQGSFVSVDAQSGKLLSTLPFKGLGAYAPVDDKGVSTFYFEDARCQAVDIAARKPLGPSQALPSAFVSILRSRDAVSALGSAGKLYLSGEGGAFSPLPPDPFLPISLILPFSDGAESGYLFLGSGSTCFIAERDLLSAEKGASLPMKTMEATYDGASAACSFGNSLYLALNGSAKPEIRAVDGSTNTQLRIPLGAASPVTRLSANGYGFLAVQANGTLSRIVSGASERLVSVNGIQDAAAVSPGRVAIGKSRGGSLAAPLLFYSIAKGELSPAPFDAIAVLRILSRGEDSFMALCIENGNDGVETTVREMRSSPYASRLIAQVKGERSGAWIGCAPDGSAFYSFGDERKLYRADPQGSPEEIALDDFPAQVCPGAGSACVLHADGSFSLVSPSRTKTGRFALGIGPSLLWLE